MCNRKAQRKQNTLFNHHGGFGHKNMMIERKYTIMYVLVDLGYLLFYRYHASLRWVEFQKDISEPINMEDIFRKHLIAQLNKLKKKYCHATFYFCKDANHDEVWRKEIYPEYKATRVQTTERTMIHRLQDVIIEVVSEFGRVFAAPRLEADDIAFLLVKRLHAKEPDAEIIIITSDRDYLQMTNERVRLLDGTGKWIEGSGDAQRDLWTKIIMGDKSDNIPAIAKGCGKKTAETLAIDPGKLHAFVAKHNCEQELERNTTLVCMDRIPRELSRAFYDGASDF